MKISDKTANETLILIA